MLRDFSKLETFLTVTREKSFSQASKKLGLSQPSVTQQIKQLETYLKAQIVDRKKNGVGLTEAGHALYQIAIKIEKCILNSEREAINILDKNQTFSIGASPVVSNYIVNDFITQLKVFIKNNVVLHVENSQNIINSVLSCDIDFGMIEVPKIDDKLVLREWMSNELILVSRSPLKKFTSKEDLYSYQWIFPNDNLNLKNLIEDAFNSIDVNTGIFDIRAKAHSTTAIKQSLLKTKIGNKPIVAILPKHMVADELIKGSLFTTQVKSLKLRRTLYLVYLKEKHCDAFTKNAIQFIMDQRKYL